MTARVRDDRGVAIVMAIIMLVVIMGLGLAAMGQAIAAHGLARRDTASKDALQAANAGMESAVFRLNTLAASLSTTAGKNTCFTVTVNASGLVTAMSKTTPSLSTGADASWCPSLPWESLGNGEGYQITVSSGFTLNSSANARRVVVVGRVVTADGRTVYRRIEQTVTVSGGTSTTPGVLNTYGVLSGGDINIDSGATIGSAAAPNGIFSNAQILQNGGAECGARAQASTTVASQSTSGNCAGNPALVSGQPAVRLPTITAPTTNNNASICSPSCPAGVSWDGSNLTIMGTTLTLAPGNYSFCSLTLQNAGATLKISPDPTSSMAIYIGPDSRIGHGCASGSVLFSGGCGIQTATPLTDSGLIDLEIANGTLTTNAGNGPCNQWVMSIFAPNGNVTTDASWNLKGSLVAGLVNLNGGTLYSNATNSGLGGTTGSSSSGQYGRSQFTECPAAPTSDPDAGC